MATTLPALFQQTVDLQLGHPALRVKQAGRYRDISYLQLAHQVQSLAAYLVDAGIGVGERVALLSENRPEWVITDQAVLAIGAVNVPLYPTLTAPQIGYILNDCGASAVVVSSPLQLAKIVAIASEVPSVRLVVVMDPDGESSAAPMAQALLEGETLAPRLAGELAARRDALRPDDLASIVYTSGTTGEPRGAMLTHHNFASNAEAAGATVGLEASDVELSFLPLSHVFERMAYYACISVGATIAYAESIETLTQNLLEVQPTFLVAVPRVLEKVYARVQAKVEAETPLKREVFWAAQEIGEFYHKLMNEEGRVIFPTNMLYQAADKLVFKTIRDTLGGRLRFIFSGGAPLAAEIGRFFQVVGLPVVEGYGLTESAPVIAVNPPDAPRFGTVGQALTGVSIRLADDGEVLARGPNIMKGYWNNPSATHEVLDADGWLHTGDIGRLDADGYLAIIDRKKELIVMSNGKKVAPAPIENKLKLHPIIEQAVLIGEGRNYITALVVPDPAAAERVARDAGERWATPEELVQCPPVRAAVAQAIARENLALAPFEQIKHFQLLAHPFSQETGELTPSLKVKRRVITGRHAEAIEAMYQPPPKVLVQA